MSKWDLKTRTCFFYVTRSSGFKAVYHTGQETTGEDKAKLIELVETFSKKYLEAVLEHGKTRADQVDEEDLEVRRQLLVEAPKV
jgi:hypothetical protein